MFDSVFEMYEVVSSIDVCSTKDFAAYHLEFIVEGVGYIANQAVNTLTKCLEVIGEEPTFCLPYIVVPK